MRMLNPSLAVVSLLGFLTAASCTLITDVDRTKIPTDAGVAQAGEPGSGGTGTGGGAGETGNGGTGNKAGTGNGATGGTEAGSGGGGGADGGMGGTNAGAAGVNEAGTGGTTTPTEACDKATGSLTFGLNTFIGDGETFALGDGVHSKVTFTFDWDDGGTPITGANVIHFSGTPTTAELAVLVTDAINAASGLDVTASTSAAGGGSNGNGGAGGESGATGATSGGQGGEGTGTPPAPKAEIVELVNQHAGERGNVTITEKLGNPNFKVSGMSGGNAVACSGDASCSSDAECDSARTCGTSHLCE